jgi:hypothetical protein
MQKPIFKTNTGERQTQRTEVFEARQGLLELLKVGKRRKKKPGSSSECWLTTISLQFDIRALGFRFGFSLLFFLTSLLPFTLFKPRRA